MTIEEAIKFAYNKFVKHKSPTPKLDAEVLLANILKVNKTFLYIHNNQQLTNNQLNIFYSFVDRRIKQEPIAYIIEEKEFYGLNFEVNNNVLIPRPETEHIVEYIIKNSIKYSTMLDICTGSGCIGISVKYNRPDIVVHFSDISGGCISIVKKNYNNLIEEINDRKSNLVGFYISDMFNSIPISNKYDIIAANPPYIKTETYFNLDDNVKFYEPRLALDGGYNGFKYYYIILEQSYKYLNNYGKIVMEIDQFISEKLIQFINSNYEHNYKIIEVIKDYSLLDRVLVLEKI